MSKSIKAISSIFKQNDKDQVRFKGLLRTYESKETISGNGYINCSFGDKETTVNCKIWDEPVMNIVKPGGVFEIVGEINDWKGQRTINIKTAVAILEPFEEYMETVPNASELTDRISKAIDKLDHSTIYYKIANHLFSSRVNAFKCHPAAKFIHHKLIGGLALHTSTMLFLGYRIKQTYENIYSIIDWNLLASGIILHDLAKLDEIHVDKGLVDYSIEGSLLGHVSMGVNLVTKACIELNIDENLEEVIMLKHMLLSHHGRTEWGSPKEPAFPEAMILHQIDVMDSNMDKFNNSFEKMKPGTWNKGVYKPL